jgi:hypothetical protein
LSNLKAETRSQAQKKERFRNIRRKTNKKRECRGRGRESNTFTDDRVFQL